MSGIFLKSIYFQTKSKKYQFRWLSKKQAWSLLVLYNNIEKNAWLEKYKIHKTEIEHDGCLYNVDIENGYKHSKKCKNEHCEFKDK